MTLAFEWDEEKARANLKKHHVSFDEAASMFDDPMLITFPDPLHSQSEERYISIGVSAKGRVLTVAHTDRGNRVRIINCRKATASEQSQYE